MRFLLSNLLTKFDLIVGARPSQNSTFIGRRQDAPQTTPETPQNTQSVAQPAKQPTAHTPTQQQQLQPTPQPVAVQTQTQPKQPGQLSPSNAKQGASGLVAQRASPGRASTSQRPQSMAPVAAPVNHQLPKLHYTVSPPAKLARDSVYATIKRRNRRSLYVSIDDVDTELQMKSHLIAER